MFYQHPSKNGSVLYLTQMINVVMSSASEAELTGLFITAKAMVPLQQSLKEMKWPQPWSPIQTENSTAHGFSNQTIVPKKQSQWIWDFTGSDAATPKANLDTIGPQGPPTGHITTLNATCPNIMSRTYHGPVSLTLTAHCKGVFLP